VSLDLNRHTMQRPPGLHGLASITFLTAVYDPTVGAVAWGGSTILCTRNVKFELSDHKDCGNEGLTATGFATVELTGNGTTVQFK